MNATGYNWLQKNSNHTSTIWHVKGNNDMFKTIKFLNYVNMYLFSNCRWSSSMYQNSTVLPYPLRVPLLSFWLLCSPGFILNNCYVLPYQLHCNKCYVLNINCIVFTCLDFICFNLRYWALPGVWINKYCFNIMYQYYRYKDVKNRVISFTHYLILPGNHYWSRSNV